MQLLLCAATELEIKPILSFISEKNLSSVHVLISGVGMMATSYALTRAVFTKKPDFILQAGIAGSLDEKLPLGQTFAVANESIGDVGVTENERFHSLFDLKLLDRNAFPWTNGILSNDAEALKNFGLAIVNGVTVNEISTDAKKIVYYKNELNASVESMEGAALHYVALNEKIPFLQLRGLSNYAGERNKQKWMMKESITALNTELERILTNIIL